MKFGFTLGKFAPFHLGHQYLIETALVHVDHLVVVIYPCTELTISLPKRANWIRTLYPQVEVIEAHDGPTVSGYSQEIIEIQDRFLISLLKDYKFDFFFSSENYGEHVSKALNCTDFRVDMPRKKIPISGTKIRACKRKAKTFLSPLVFEQMFNDE